MDQSTLDGPVRHGPPPLPGAPVWPMPVAQFLAGNYLHRADVILTRRHWDMRSTFIRWATRSHFSHAALVFLVPHQELDFNNTFVIEADGDGVGLNNLARYLNDARTVVGIRRLKGGWFDNNMQKLVRGRMLNSIKSPYAYGQVLKIGRGLMARLMFGLRDRIYGRRKAIETLRHKNWQAPNEFICSGLVQMGYVEAIGLMVRQGRLHPLALAEVILHRDVARMLDGTDWEQFTAAEQLEIIWEFVGSFSDELQAATPSDLAQTPKLQWVYVVKNKMVYQVASAVEAEAALNWSPEWDPEVQSA